MDIKSQAAKVVGVRAAITILAIGILALLAPIIWSAVTAGVGLLVIGGLVVIGMAAIQALPWLGQKWENKVLAFRKAEARANPIEQLQNYLMEKANRVLLFKEAVIAIGAQIHGMQTMIENRKLQKPGYDATKQLKAVEAMRDAHAVLIGKYKAAEEALEQLKDVIEDTKFEWSFGQAGQAAAKSLNATSGQELVDEMLKDEAFSSVRDNFNHVFAELELEASKLTTSKSLTFDGGLTLDLGAINIPQLETLKR